ncbi:restriction endonuclease subunit S [Crateriforma conspicua]|nr:restriction endonuclease subunit S [Crateriforma conspicua]
MTDDSLPKGWRMVHFRDVAESRLGKMLDKKKNKGSLKPYLRNPNVQWFKIDTSDLQMMPFEDGEEEKYGLNVGDVVICEGGEAGRAAIWDGSLPNMMIQKAIHRVRCSDDLLNRYLIYQLKIDYESGALSEYYTGTTIKHLTGQDLAEYRFPLPPISEQRRIAGILDAADAIRRKRQQAIALTEQFLRSTFLDMFGESVEARPSWKRRALADVLFFQEGPGVRKWQFRDKGIKLINVRNIVNGKLDPTNTERYLDELEVKSKYSHFLADEGDLVMATSGVTWGKTAWVRAEHLPICMNTSMVRFRPLDESEITREFMRAFLMSLPFTRQIDRLVTGSAQPNFGPSHLKQVEISLPPIELQLEYEAIAKNYDSAKRKSEKAMDQQDNLFNSLVQRAFRGEL